MKIPRMSRDRHLRVRTSRDQTIVCAIHTTLLMIGCVLFLGASVGGAGSDPTAKISFVGKNGIATAHGVFHQFKIIDSQILPEDMGQSHVTVEIDVASLDTDNKRRDDHLRTADFFEVARWPLATVHVHSAQRIEGERYRATFDVEIRDVKKSVDGEFEVVSWTPFSVKGNLVLDRMDFRIGTPKTWNPMTIKHEVPVSFEATLPN